MLIENILDISEPERLFSLQMRYNNFKAAKLKAEKTGNEI